MTYRPGQSGNPGGRSLEKVFTPHFRAIGNEIDPKTQRRKARLLCEKVWAAALKGDPWAINCVLDRLDGRPMMESQLTVMRRDIRTYSDEELQAIIAKQQQKPEQEPEEKRPAILQ
jgi:hypothetical protein